MPDKAKIGFVRISTVGAFRLGDRFHAYDPMLTEYTGDIGGLPQGALAWCRWAPAGAGVR